MFLAFWVSANKLFSDHITLKVSLQRLMKGPREMLSVRCLNSQYPVATGTFDCGFEIRLTTPSMHGLATLR